MYLIRVFRHSKRMGIAFGGFALLSLVVNAIKYEATPLFLWGMFSANSVVEKEYKVFQFVGTDEDTLNYTDFGTANTMRTLLIGTADLAATIVLKDTNPALKVYIQKFQKRLSPVNFEAVKDILVFDILKNDKNRMQLYADSLWRNRLLETHFHTKIKNTYTQTVVYQDDGSVIALKK
jgi:hypothetical protein